MFKIFNWIEDGGPTYKISKSEIMSNTGKDSGNFHCSSDFCKWCCSPVDTSLKIFWSNQTNNYYRPPFKAIASINGFLVGFLTALITRWSACIVQIPPFSGCERKSIRRHYFFAFKLPIRRASLNERVVNHWLLQNWCLVDCYSRFGKFKIGYIHAHRTQFHYCGAPFVHCCLTKWLHVDFGGMEFCISFLDSAHRCVEDKQGKA